MREDPGADDVPGPRASGDRDRDGDAEEGRRGARRAVTRDALALGAAVGVAGASFGALAVTAGLSAAQAQALSLLMFTGGSQFALVGVLSAGGALLSAVAVAWLLGARNTLYAVRLADLLDLRGRRGLVLGQLVIDETTAMATAQPDRALARHAYRATGAAVYGFWNLGTAVGALAVEVVPDPADLGLDAAFPAAFLALLAPRLGDGTARLVALGGAVLAVSPTPVLPPGVPVLVAVVAVVPAVLRARRTGDGRHHGVETDDGGTGRGSS